RVDLVISDVVMPKMDGPTLIKQVRELYPDRALKVIFMSGYTEDNFRKRLGDDIDIHFLPKPFSLKQLAGKVKEVMAEPDQAPPLFTSLRGRRPKQSSGETDWIASLR